MSGFESRETAFAMPQQLKPKFFADDTIGPAVSAAPAWTEYDFTSGGASQLRNLRIENAGGAVVSVSFDGTNKHGELGAGSTKEWRDLFEKKVYLQSVAGADPFKIEAW